MKHCIFIIIVIGLGACQSSEKSPQMAEKMAHTEGVWSLPPDFMQRFPDAQEVVWDSLEQGFVVDFCNQNGTHQAYYDAQNRFLHTLSYLDETALPAKAQTLLRQKWPQALVAVVFLMEKEGKKSYQVELETEAAYINVAFDLKGQLLSESSTPLSDEERNRLEEEGVDGEE